jgi:protease-4
MRKCTVPAIAAIAMALLSPLACDLDGDDQQVPSGPKGPIAVIFEVDGPLPHFPDPTGLLGAIQVSQHRLEQLLARAASDIQVQEVVVHLGAPEIGWARAGEVGDAIARVAQAGKPVTCHLEAADNMTYWLAARSCPRVVIAPAGGVDLVGLSLEAVHVKELLDSIGVSADMLHIGRYKDAAEPLTQNELSPEAREAANSLLDDLQRQLVAGIVAGRKLDDQAVGRLIDGGPYTAEQAQAKGLVDGVETLGSLLDKLRDKHAGGVVDDYGKEPPKPLGFGDMLKLLSGDMDEQQQPSHPHIALVSAVGPIVSGAGDDLLGGMEVVYDLELVQALSEAARDPAVKAVVLRVDSPGGSALASDNIWEAVRALKERKPVVVSMGDVAASGGYYIAAGATEILAGEPTLTGSIGVVGGKLVLGDTLTKIGVHVETLSRGQRAAIGSPLKPFTDEERVAVQLLMQDAYDMFVDRIVSGQGIPRDKVLAAAEGRVWTGAQAIDAGLLTGTGTLNDAIERARKLGQLPGGPVEIHPKPKTFMEILSEAFADQETGVIAAARRLGPGRRALALASLLRSQRVLAFAPLHIEVR